MQTPTHRAVLDPATSRDQLDAAMAALGLKLINVLPNLTNQPAQLIYLHPDGMALHVVDDLQLGVTYVASSDGILIDDLRAELTCLPEDGHIEAFAAAAEAPAWRLALAQAVLTLKQPDGATLDGVARALSHDDPQVRQVALQAVAYVRWLELRAALASVRDADAEPVLRQHAAMILNAWDNA